MPGNQETAADDAILRNKALQMCFTGIRKDELKHSDAKHTCLSQGASPPS